MAIPSGASMHITIRLQFAKQLVSFGDIATAIGQAGGDIVGIDVISSSKTHTVRDITVSVLDSKHADLVANGARHCSYLNKRNPLRQAKDSFLDRREWCCFRCHRYHAFYLFFW